MFNRGIIINYDKKRGFGFIKQKDFKDNLYFHIHGRNKVSINYYLGKFVHNLCKDDQLSERIPQLGEEIVCKLKTGIKGNIIARYWCFGDEFDQVTKQIEEVIKTLENLEWRLMFIFEYPLKDTVVTTIEWQGDNPFDCPLDTYDPENDYRFRSYPDYCLIRIWKSKSKVILNADWQECNFPKLPQ